MKSVSAATCMLICLHVEHHTLLFSDQEDIDVTIEKILIKETCFVTHTP